MNQYTDEQIKNTLNIIESTIKNCEKIQPKFKEGTPQLSLSRNRIKALNVSKDLITQQDHNYTEEELSKAATQITSIINKSQKAMINAKEGTGTYTRLKKIIDAIANKTPNKKYVIFFSLPFLFLHSKKLSLDAAIAAQHTCNIPQKQHTMALSTLNTYIKNIDNTISTS